MSIRKSKWTHDGVSHWSVADGHETIGVVDVIDGEYLATDVDGNVVGRFASLRDATRAFGAARGVEMPVSVARKIEFLVRSDGEYLDVQVGPSSSPGSKPALPAWQRQRLRRKRMRPEPAPEHSHATPSISEAGRGRPVSING